LSLVPFLDECSTPLGIGYRYAVLVEGGKKAEEGAQRLSASDIATPNFCSVNLGRFLCSTPLGIGYRYAVFEKSLVMISYGCSTPLGIGYRYARRIDHLQPSNSVLNASRHRISLRLSK